MSEQPVRITRIFQPITIDLRGTDGRKWDGVVERVSFNAETGRVTLELWSQEEFQQRYEAMRRTVEEAGQQ